MGSLGTVRQSISVRNVLNRVSSTFKQVLYTNDFASMLRRFARLFTWLAHSCFLIKKTFLFSGTKSGFPKGI